MARESRSTSVTAASSVAWGHILTPPQDGPRVVS